MAVRKAYHFRAVRTVKIFDIRRRLEHSAIGIKPSLGGDDRRISPARKDCGYIGNARKSIFLLGGDEFTFFSQHADKIISAGYRNRHGTRKRGNIGAITDSNKIRFVSFSVTYDKIPAGSKQLHSADKRSASIARKHMSILCKSIEYGIGCSNIHGIGP